MNNLRNVIFGVVGTVAISPLGAVAQTVPVAPAAPRGNPAIGPAYGPNDPCTSLGAIVGRPSQTNSVCTVRPNHILIESGYQNTIAGSTSTLVQYPQALVRIGTTVPALEVDIGLPVYERERAGGTTTSGTTDAGAGLKYVLGYTSRFNYGTSVFFTAPTGANGFSAGAGTQTYALNYGYTLNSLLSLAGTFSFNTLSADGQRYASIIPSLVLSAGLPNATGLFIEAAQFGHGAGPGTATRAQFIGGLTHGLSARSQIDLEAGGSPTNATGKYHFVGFGASFYF